MSYELITSNINAQSLTSLVIGPAWSNDEAKATMPYLEQLPYVGLSPTVPVNEAGWRIDPPVSVPMVAGVNFAAKADAEPPEDPPGTRFSPIGFWTFPKKLVSLDDPIANSSQFNFPSKIAPFSHKLFVTVDSYVGTKLFKILLPAVVLKSFVQNKSLTAIGIPGNFFSKLGLLSNASAFFNAWSKSSVIKEFSFFDFLHLSIYAFVVSLDETSFFLILSINSTSVKSTMLDIILPPLVQRRSLCFHWVNFLKFVHEYSQI